MKMLVLFRGLPGSGKTTIAKRLVEYSVAADDFPGLYEGGFNKELLGQAHSWCLDTVEGWMATGIETIAVHNTFVNPWEMEKYFSVANKYGYDVSTVIVENRHGNASVHDVPDETVKRMESNFKVKLRW
jgi:predicted kinase